MSKLRELEQHALAEGREWTRARLERDLQAESDAFPALCPQSERPLQDVEWRPMTLRSVSGPIHLRVRYGYSAAMKQWITPIRLAWGLDKYERLSPELAARLTHTVAEVGSYERTAAMSAVWGSPVSDGCLHAMVQRMGQRVDGLKLPPEEPRPSPRAFSLVIMMDGWLARTRGPDWGVGPRSKQPERVAWCEIKSAVIYRLDQRGENAAGRGLLSEKFIVACPPGTDPVDFGAAVHAEAGRRGLAQAEHVYLVMDGAVWLWDLAAERFPQAIKTLDFHHAREHLQAVADAEHGVGTTQAKAWLEKMIDDLREGKEARALRRIEALLEPVVARAPQAQEAIEREIGYFQDHSEHIHYQARQNEGSPRGSGAVESLGKQLQARLRGCGQFWSRHGLSNLLKVCVVTKNDDAHLLWN